MRTLASQGLPRDRLLSAGVSFDPCFACCGSNRPRPCVCLPLNSDRSIKPTFPIRSSSKEGLTEVGPRIKPKWRIAAPSPLAHRTDVKLASTGLEVSPGQVRGKEDILWRIKLPRNYLVEMLRMAMTFAPDLKRTIGRHVYLRRHDKVGQPSTQGLKPERRTRPSVAREDNPGIPIGSVSSARRRLAAIFSRQRHETAPCLDVAWYH
jgi:hypothetical protein